MPKIPILLGPIYARLIRQGDIEMVGVNFKGQPIMRLTPQGQAKADALTTKGINAQRDNKALHRVPEDAHGDNG